MFSNYSYKLILITHPVKISTQLLRAIFKKLVNKVLLSRTAKKNLFFSEYYFIESNIIAIANKTSQNQSIVTKQLIFTLCACHSSEINQKHVIF